MFKKLLLTSLFVGCFFLAGCAQNSVQPDASMFLTVADWFAFEEASSSLVANRDTISDFLEGEALNDAQSFLSEYDLITKQYGDINIPASELVIDDTAVSQNKSVTHFTVLGHCDEITYYIDLYHQNSSDKIYKVEVYTLA